MPRIVVSSLKDDLKGILDVGDPVAVMNQDHGVCYLNPRVYPVGHIRAGKV
jgi:hypothetical protein